MTTVPRPDVDDILLISPSARRQLPSLAAIAAFLAAYAALGAAGVLEGWLVWVGVLVFGTVLVVGVVTLLWSRRAPWELRLAPDGVTVRGRDAVPWSDLAEVRVTGLRPRWVFLSSFGVRVVSFVPRPGVELTPLPSARLTGPLERWSAGRRASWYGSQLVVLPSGMDASASTIADAVSRLSEVPVTGRRRSG